MEGGDPKVTNDFQGEVVSAVEEAKNPDEVAKARRDCKKRQFAFLHAGGWGKNSTQPLF